MLKRTIDYVDFEGNKQQETFYFNFSKFELAEMEYSVDGGLSKQMEKILAAEKVGQMLGVMKMLVLKSVGVKSDDNKRFVKTDEIAQDFVSSPAFEVLIFDVATDANKAAEFIKGIVPAEFASELDKKSTDSAGAVELSVAPVETS